MELVYICRICGVVYDVPAPEVCEYCKQPLVPEKPHIDMDQDAFQKFKDNEKQMAKVFWRRVPA